MCFEQIAPDIELLRVPLGPIWTGVFLVSGAETYLIDSGSSGEDVRQYILPALEQRGIKPGDIAYLLCTHCHGDHVGGHQELTSRGFRAACFAGSAVKLRDPLYYSRRIRAAFPGYSPEAPSSLRGCVPVRLIGDSELLGGFLRLIHTPGHDTDTVCFLDERSGTLISGDSLQWNGTVTQGTALVMELPYYLQSLERLRALAPERILPGHPYLPVGDKIEGRKACGEALRQCALIMDEYRRFLEESWEAGEHNAARLAERLIGQIGGLRPEHLFLPLYTVREQLVALGHPVTFGE